MNFTLYIILLLIFLLNPSLTYQIHQQNSRIKSFLPQNQSTSTLKRKVVLIGIDGLEYNVLQRLQKEGQLEHIPKLHIQKAVSGGIVNTPQETPTVSGPMWTSLLTGVYMNKHHVTTNQDVSPNQKYPSVFQFIKEQREDAIMYSVANWKTIKTQILRRDRKYLNGNYRYDNDLQVTNKVSKLIQKEGPDFIFLQLDEVDHAGHEVGYCEEFDKVVIKEDMYVGQIMEAIEKRKQEFQDEEWLVLVTADHGRQTNTHDHGEADPQQFTEKQIFIATNYDHFSEEFKSEIQPPRTDYQNLYRYPSSVSITPTILSYLGVFKDLKHQEFDAIPFYGEIGLQKLMLGKEGLVQWGVSPVEQTDKKLKQKSDDFVEIFTEDGEFIEKVPFQEGQWPSSEIGKEAWKNNKNFRFKYNGVNVWYSNAVCQVHQGSFQNKVTYK